MTRKWLQVALVITGLVGTARAQNPYLPNQGMSPPMPEPIPFRSHLAGLEDRHAQPEPVPDEAASPLALRSDLPNAWTEDIPKDPGARAATRGRRSLPSAWVHRPGT